MHDFANKRMGRKTHNTKIEKIDAEYVDKNGEQFSN